MVNRNYKNFIQSIEKDIKYQYPSCNLEWYYDEKNIQDFEGISQIIMIQVVEMLKSFCFCSNNIHLYIRVHRYRQWYIFRIVANKGLSKKSLKYIENQVSNVKNVCLVNVEKRKKQVVIKITMHL